MKQLHSQAHWYHLDKAKRTHVSATLFDKTTFARAGVELWTTHILRSGDPAQPSFSHNLKIHRYSEHIYTKTWNHERDADFSLRLWQCISASVYQFTFNVQDTKSYLSCCKIPVFKMLGRLCRLCNAQIRCFAHNLQNIANLLYCLRFKGTMST